MLQHSLLGDDDPFGLICAFRLAPLSMCGADVLTGAAPDHQLWLHFNAADSRTRLWLESQSSIPEEAREILLEAETRIRAKKLRDGFVVVLGDLHHDFNEDPEGFGELCIYVDSTRMITTRRHPLKAPDRLRRCLKGPDAYPENSASAMFWRLVELLTESFTDVVSELSDRVDDAEDRILAGDYRRHAGTLGGMRRLLARLRRHIGANRAALALVPQSSGDAASPDGLTPREAIERWEALGQDLDLVQERARLLQEEIAGRLNEATNRSLFVLSVVTTALLPITLLTGVFGMNVGGLPWVGHPHGFAHVLVVMGASVVLALVLLWRRHLFW